jgi:hypothetical protein
MTRGARDLWHKIANWQRSTMVRTWRKLMRVRRSSSTQEQPAGRSKMPKRVRSGVSCDLCRNTFPSLGKNMREQIKRYPKR